MRSLFVGCVAVTLAVLSACGSDCNADCRDCRQAVRTQFEFCDQGCAGDAECLDACDAALCQADDACDGEIGDDPC